MSEVKPRFFDEASRMLAETLDKARERFEELGTIVRVLIGILGKASDELAILEKRIAKLEARVEKLEKEQQLHN
jgi:ubiquinone biosynthesis protein UbiJ